MFIRFMIKKSSLLLEVIQTSRVDQVKQKTSGGRRLIITCLVVMQGDCLLRLTERSQIMDLFLNGRATDLVSARV